MRRVRRLLAIALVGIICCLGLGEASSATAIVETTASRPHTDYDLQIGSRDYERGYAFGYSVGHADGLDGLRYNEIAPSRGRYVRSYSYRLGYRAGYSDGYYDGEHDRLRGRSQPES